MGRNDKLTQKIKNIPKDLKYSDLKKFLESLGYMESNKGKTSGSRVIFFRATDNDKIGGDKPHGNGPVSVGWLKRVVKHLEEKGDL